MRYDKAGLAGFLTLIALWALLARGMSPLAMASPGEALLAAWRMVTDGRFLLQHLAVTVYRVLLALLAGSLAGFFLGLLAGSVPCVMGFLEPFRRVGTGIPGIVVAVLAMLWFGMGDAMAIFIGAVFIVPVVYINVAQSLRKGDASYLEMARVYRIPPGLRLRCIYAPMVGAALASSLIIGTGNCMRLVILAEVLGTGNGLGYVLSLARARLDMPGLYGSVLLCLAFVWCGELAFKKLLFRRFYV
jgi:NitT/TauT family transport system permease protein